MFQKCKKATALFVASILTVAFVQVSALAQPANDTAMQLKVKNDQLALYLSSDNSKLELKDLSTGYILEIIRVRGSVDRISKQAVEKYDQFYLLSRICFCKGQ